VAQQPVKALAGKIDTGIIAPGVVPVACVIGSGVKHPAVAALEGDGDDFIRVMRPFPRELLAILAENGYIIYYA
jgi:hypothetical protein